ncbi:hypothetical protein MLD38_005718 [Melastoma candidum]|uniref:Uncharacterized protein n=1 Tax=Melastoma candidum TaxID=119954 RepID=A0ACB9RNL3_9MYRT|nr:hypothetical protein MLD38_005718 [Melastoma candidum]
MKPLQSPDEDEDAVTFDKSLKELRELGSQLHYAADYCSSAFLRTKEKTVAVENTREYICRAMVTVVDHLGSVSSNLDFRVSNFSRFAEAELRMHSLEQRLLCCQDYATKLALTRTRWNPVLPKFSSRYLLTRLGHGGNESRNVALRDVKKGKPNVTGDCVEFKAEEGMPLFIYTETKERSAAKNLTAKCAAIERKNTISSIVPVSDCLSKPSQKSQKPTFHFQSTKKIRESIPSRKSANGSDIKSLIRRVKGRCEV